jgi:hypothetical protein
MSDELGKSLTAERFDPRRMACFRCVDFGNERLSEASLLGSDQQRQDASDGTDCAVESELAQKQRTIEPRGFDCPDRTED